jgi:hypothetical protein
MFLFITIILYCVGLIWFVVGSKGRVFAKIAYILATAYFTVSIFITANNLSGWPTEDELPSEFYPVHIEVNEPRKIDGSGGSIYIWCYSEEHGKINDKFSRYFINFKSIEYMSTPRAYKIRYSKDSHVAVEKISNAMSERKYIKIESIVDEDDNSIDLGGSNFKIKDVYIPNLK